MQRSQTKGLHVGQLGGLQHVLGFHAEELIRYTFKRTQLKQERQLSSLCSTFKHEKKGSRELEMVPRLWLVKIKFL